jgi:hypothetical protein
MSRETLVPQGAQPVLVQQQRASTQAAVSAQRLVLPGNLVHADTNNTFSMVPGHYGDYVGKAAAVMQGAPGTTFAAGAYKAQVQAATIRHTDAVTVHGTANGQWMNSQFAAVTVQKGAKAKFTNCRFSGKLDNSAGAAADVVCIGCFFDVEPVNVTVIG